MKQIGLGLSLSALLIGLGLYMYNKPTDNTGEFASRKQQMLHDLFELERQQIADPSTGEVPHERLLLAKAYIQRLLGQQNNNRAPILGINWVERGPNNVSGRTRALAVDLADASGNTIWAGGVGGGLWKTTNMQASNPTWTSVGGMFENIAISFIVQDPSNLQVLYAGTGEGFGNADSQRGLGIWKTSDGGNTWAQLASTNNSSFHYVRKMAIDATGILYAATPGGLRRTTDGGTSWTNVQSGSMVDVEVGTDGKVWVCRDGTGIYTSPDGTSGSFTLLSSANFPSGSLGRIEIGVSESDPNRAYALWEGSGGVCQAISRTNDGGSTWSALTVPTISPSGSNFASAQAWYDLTIGIDPNNPDRFFIGGLDLVGTTNGGSSWTQVSQWYGAGFPYVHADHHGIYYQPGSSSICYFTNDGGVFQSTNANVSSPAFSFKSDGYNVTQFYACDIDPTAYSPNAVAGAQDNGSQYFDNAGIDNTVEINGGDGAYCHIDQDNANLIIVSYIYDDFTVFNNGSTSSFTFGAGNIGRFISPTDYDDDANVLYACHNNGVYGYVTNIGAGNNVSSNAVAAFNGAKISCITVSPNTANRVFFGLDNGDVVMVDNANTASPIATLVYNGSGYTSCIEIETGNDDHMLVTYSNYGVVSIFESTNATNASPVFNSIEGNLPDIPVRWALFSPLNNDQAMIATELGVWSTDNLDGASTQWSTSNSGLANTRVTMLKLRQSDYKVIASTHGRGLFESDVFTTPEAMFGAQQSLGYAGKNINFIDASYKATSWLWDFGDGNTATVQNPAYAYTNPGVFTVSLDINGGFDIETKPDFITILPERNTSYLNANGGNFESAPFDFARWTVSGTAWVKGNSATAGKNGTASGSNAWVTGLSGNYVDNSESYLYGPAFDFSQIATYTFQFRAKFNTENTWDGFRVEYSLNKGDTWAPLGTTTAAGWYNYANTAGSRPFPTGQAFFSGNQSSAFNTYSYDASALAGNATVAFRFAFKSDGSVTNPGVALDDVEVIKSNVVLPVELLRFEANAFPNHVALRWQTASETDNLGFEVQRSQNGLDFNAIGFVDGFGPGTSMLLQSYSFNDEQVLDGLLYYRLKQKDIDETYAYSPVVSVEYKSGQAKGPSVFPNPFDDVLYLNLGDLNAGTYQLSIYNVQGQLLVDRNISISKGVNQAIPELQSAAPGAYFIRIRSGASMIYSEKVLKF
jgi:photosystem II stability/assembly factor-like uncharacterized protein